MCPDSEKKKHEYKDLMSAALLHLSDIGDVDKVFESILLGTTSGIETLSNHCKEVLKDATEDEILYKVYEISSFANAASMILLQSVSLIIKDEVLKSFTFFASMNMTAAVLQKRGVLTHDQISDLSARTALLSPETVKEVLGEGSPLRRETDPAEEQLGIKQLPEGFMDDLAAHFSGKKREEIMAKMGSLFNKLS